MSMFISLAATVLLVSIVSFVLACHWSEFHGDNHF